MAAYFVRKRVEFSLGGKTFVALEVDYNLPVTRVDRELYIVHKGLELFVGYIGQLHLDDYRLAPLQSRAAKKLDAALSRTRSYE